MSKIKVLIVDDSAFMRKAIESMLNGEPDIEIVGFGANGEDAVKMTAKLRPDVITLDVEMPKMNGLQALEIIMKDTPTPVIMVSSLTQEGADTTLKALDMGAVDFIPKEKSYGSVGILKISNELKSKVRKFAGDKSILRRISSHRTPIRPSTTASTPVASTATKTSTRAGFKKIVALGTSTGGPQSLQRVIPLLPADLGVPVLIVQHMPPSFTASLAARLNSLSKVTVVEAQGGEVVQPNWVYIAKGGKQMVIKRGGVIELKPEDNALLHNPCVDVMVASVAEVYGKDALGVIMTGMGNDGTKGLTELKKKGGLIVSQDEASCIVYGMPRAVVEAGIADDIVPLDEIAKRIEYHCKG
ncbi:MAG: chemotaxis response regulator protein-glutamate methylesterase [Deferribacteraceae bacterium]|jgi:two-component system chemotaxis response regulator CheB|nr:chemotaxis response regulator protein-glutamate methylesterase [Deferribacteraceae bacterium]